MQRLRTWATWLDSNILLILAAFLLAFIPLFPKIPLFDILPGYIVRVRIEDFLVIFTGMVWLIQIFRKKVEWKHTVLIFVLAYIALGLISMILGSILTQTIPPQLIHIGKSTLHFFRYLEYFSLFFFTYSAVRTKKHLEILIGVLAVTVIAIACYGAGQKYLNWPLFSTMNREYSKGEALYLSEYARVQSTFAGHYDLTAYLVLVLPILGAVALATKNSTTQLLLGLSQVGGIWLLLVGSSKGSLAAYVVTISLVLFFKLKSMRVSVAHSLKWVLVALLGLTFLSISIVFFSPELYKTIATTSKPIAPFYNVFLKIDDTLPNDSALKLVRTNVSPEGTVKPDDVYVDVPDYVKVATTSATGEPTFILVEKERTWSDNALKYGLSMGIRLDTLWPQALSGLMKNPLTGSGYATLNKGDSTVYTEADSTDNNFLRVLGETGLIGFILFFGLVYFLCYTALRNSRSSNNFITALNVGYVAGLFGLLINAVTIDVFAASKVAFTFWGISGFVYATKRIESKSSAETIERAYTQKTIDFIQKHGLLLVVIVLHFFATYQNPFTEKSVILNFAQNMHGAEYVATARCYLRNGSFELCRNTLTVDQPTNFYSVALVPFLKMYNNPGMYAVLNGSYLFTVLLVFYWALLKITTHSKLRYAMVLLLLSTPTFLHSTAMPGGTLDPIFMALLLLLVVFCIEQTRKALPTRQQLLVLGVRVLVSLSVLLFVVTFLNAQQFSKTLAAFSGTQPHWRNRAVTQMNTFFSAALIGKQTESDTQSLPFVITATNPYYIDLFSNGLYTILPMYPEQRHMEHPMSVWGAYDYSELLSLYETLLSTHPVYLSEVDITTKESKDAFEKIHAHFDLTVARIGCNFNCNIYRLLKETERISPIPTSITTPLQPETLREDYSFNIISTRFDENQPPTATPLTLGKLVETYSAAQKNSAFSVITGDILPKYDDSQIATFVSLYKKQPETQPLLFVPGNFDVLPKKNIGLHTSSFFTKNEYFLLLTPESDGTISETQQVEILNQLLLLKKMPEITTIFVISHQANWIGYHPELQELSQRTISRSPQPKDTFMINQVLPKLESLRDKKVFVVAGDMIPTDINTPFEKKLPESNLHFLSSIFSIEKNAHYIEFTKQNNAWSFAFKTMHSL